MSSVGFGPEKRQNKVCVNGQFEKLVNIRIRDVRRQISMKIGSYFIVNWALSNVLALNNSDVQAPFILQPMCMLNGGLSYCLTAFFLVALPAELNIQHSTLGNNLFWYICCCCYCFRTNRNFFLLLFIVYLRLF